MRLIDRIRAMSVGDLADYLIISGETTDCDEDEDGVMYEFPVNCWLTPWAEYPGWWSYNDVKEVAVEALLSGE